MVVDKDVEGLGEWTLGEVKTEWVRTLTYCSSDGRIKAKGKSARLANFLCTGRIMICEELDVVCCSIWTPCWSPQYTLHFILQFHLCLSTLPLYSPEDEGLPQCVHLLVQWIRNNLQHLSCPHGTTSN